MTSPRPPDANFLNPFLSKLDADLFFLETDSSPRHLRLKIESAVPSEKGLLESSVKPNQAPLFPLHKPNQTEHSKFQTGNWTQPTLPVSMRSQCLCKPPQGTKHTLGSAHRQRRLQCRKSSCVPTRGFRMLGVGQTSLSELHARLRRNMHTKLTNTPYWHPI